MLKSFAGLWLLVFGPLFFLLYPSQYNPIVRFNEHIEGQRFIHIYQGTLRLIESRLTIIPESERQKSIASLKQKFGFDIRLVPLTSLSLSDKQKALLQQGAILFINAEPESLLKTVPQSDQVLQFFTDVSAEEKIRRGAQGSIYLLQQAFENTPSQDWPSLLEQLSVTFSFDMEIIAPNLLNPTLDEQQQIEQDGFFWREEPSGDLSFYAQLPAKKGYLNANLIPMTSVDLSVVLILIVVFVLLISVCMFLWVYPLWRDLRNLLVAASEFGKGNLHSRAEVSKISVVASLGSTFNQMAKKIEQLLEGQKTLTNAIAHDLRTPLYRIRFAFEMLDDSTSKEQNNQYRQTILNSIDDVEHLVNQTLQLSRYSNKIQLANFASYNLSSILEWECHNIFQLYPTIQYTLNIEPQCRDKLAYVDKTAMQRAVSNLVINACKYAHSQVEVALVYDLQAEQFIIEVSDDGPGINEADLERIFMPFEQLNSTRAESNNGYGLGLAIVSHIARWHGGTITAGRSALGGALFVFNLPSEYRCSE